MHRAQGVQPSFHIESIRAFIRQLAEQLGFRPTRIKDIELIIDEICSNAIEHGSENSVSGIDLTLTLDGSQLEILIQDKGGKKQNNWLETGRLDEVSRERSPGRERGHGLYIARKLSDHFAVHPNSQGGTNVRVVFHLSPLDDCPPFA